MGELYKGRDTRLNRIVAVKVLPAHLADRPELRERFKREAETIGNIGDLRRWGALRNPVRVINLRSLVA